MFEIWPCVNYYRGDKVDFFFFVSTAVVPGDVGQFYWFSASDCSFVFYFNTVLIMFGSDVDMRTGMVCCAEMGIGVFVSRPTIA